ncbi:MAG TPA: hypothetical protein DIU42_11765 [Dermacoccus sp.]|nr:hypothetical protein [Dermacoccus sp.]
MRGARVLDIKAFGVEVPGAKTLVGGSFDGDDAMGGRQAWRDRRTIPHERRDAGGAGERGPVACVENARRAARHADHLGSAPGNGSAGEAEDESDARRWPGPANR